eukprot:326123-Amphidinium_carterae.2
MGLKTWLHSAPVEMQERYTRVRQGVRRAASARKPHQFVWTGGRWQCLKCRRAKLTARAEVDKKPCVSINLAINRVTDEAAQLGHLLLAVRNEATHQLVFICGR